MTKKEIAKRYYENHKKECLERNKQYRDTHKEERRITNKKYYEKNKEKYKEYQEKYRKEHKDEINKKHREYRKTHKDNKEIKKKAEKRRLKNPLYRFKHITRNAISRSFSRCGKRKNTRTESILGCSIEDFRSYIESKFKDGMTFENYGQWHLDHIIPLASANTEEDIIKLCHYTNFQPLWKEENLKKGATMIQN